MTRLFIVGGAGQIARRLTPLLVERGHAVSSLYRKAEQEAELADLGATPVEGDLTALSVDALAERMRGHDAVLFAAGAGGAGQEITNAVDGEGLRKTVDAARAAGVDRVLLISVFPEAGRTKGLGEGFENYMAVKKEADVYLVQSGLDYFILRPGTLTDEAGTGKVAADYALSYGSVTRDDVAAFLAEIVDRGGPARAIVELTGGETPAAEAAARL